MSISPKPAAIDYATASRAVNIRRTLKITVCVITCLLCLLIIVADPALGLPYDRAGTSYRIGTFERSLGFVVLTEEVPVGPLPPPAKHKFLGFIYIDGRMQEGGLRAAGMVVTKQYHITAFGIPAWLPMLVSLVVLFSRPLTTTFKRFRT